MNQTKRLSAIDMKQLRADARSMPSYERSEWWKESKRLLKEQGFSMTKAQERSIDNIVY